MTEDLTQRFYKVYNNLPINLREEVVVVFPGENIQVSWNVAFLEVKGNTSLGRRILEKLASMGII